MRLPCARPVYLLTPGPLTTSKATKQAMLQDWGSRDAEFKEMTTTVRRKLLELIGDTKESSSALHFKGAAPLPSKRCWERLSVPTTMRWHWRVHRNKGT